MHSFDIGVRRVSLYFLPVTTRVPLKFGAETVTGVTCARVAVEVANEAGQSATGWGETPLSVTWVWPGSLSYETRHTALKEFAVEIARSYSSFRQTGHPMEIGHAFIETQLGPLLGGFNEGRSESEQMPYLAALVCLSAFDIALHDAYGRVHDIPVYETYNSTYMNHDLSHYLEPASGASVSFDGLYPSDLFTADPPESLLAWHLVGGTDPIDSDQQRVEDPADGYPVYLRDWIDRDGLDCLKIKLRGNDPDWDYDRIVTIGEVARGQQVTWLTADFNCTVEDPSYVTRMLDRLRDREPDTYGKLLYVEQPFPYDLERQQIDVHSVSARKPLFMDESAHDWKLIRLGRQLGWTGVALKTCKTQTGALLSLCWARMHGMTLMVQDLTNPMLAQIPHVLLAAHAGTIMGVETNAMQYYPEASLAEAAIHPGLYRRTGGRVHLNTLSGPGFGYAGAELARTLPAPAFAS